MAIVATTPARPPFMIPVQHPGATGRTAQPRIPGTNPVPSAEALKRGPSALAQLQMQAERRARLLTQAPLSSTNLLATMFAAAASARDRAAREASSQPLPMVHVRGGY